MPREFSLILSALRKHQTICALIVLQIAIACAVLGNGLNLVSQRYKSQGLPTGLAENQLFVLDVEVLRGYLEETQRDEVLAAVGALPNVRSAAYVNTLPFSGRGGSFKLVHDEGNIEREVGAALYYGSAGFMRTLGVRVVAGRGFTPEDFRSSDSGPLARTTTLILTESLSRRLSAPVGSRIEIAGRTLTVIGIAQDVMKPVLTSSDDAFNTAFIPSLPSGAASSQIVINAEHAGLSDVVGTATRITPKALIWSARAFTQIHADYFRLDRAVIRLILVLGILLALVVAGGVGGLSSYWILRRYKQIATRRALGARRRDIAWYFHIENFIITSIGAVLGLVAAIAVSVMLTKWLAVPPMPIASLSWGGLAMVVIGQLAILAPVRRAITVPPAMMKVT